ncbi:Calcium uniporter protein 4, mitochondrial [Linum grandiflorum]
MALRKLFSKRLPAVGQRAPSPPAVKYSVNPNSARSNLQQELQDVSKSGLNWRRFIHRTALRNHLPEFLSLPVGDKLLEKLRLVNVTDDRLQWTGLNPPPPPPPTTTASSSLAPAIGVSVEEVRKILRLAQMEKLKARLSSIQTSSIPMAEFAQICVQECGNEDQGAEFAKTLDESGNVIVLGNIVFLRPEQVAKSMESIISQSIAHTNDPRKKTLEEMHEEKFKIDRKARAQVRAELYCGLGFLTAQTVGFMRLTFWELSWDVMEPICFFTTSLYFGMAYTFFLRTSIEPTFEGYFGHRFDAKQKKLMKLHGFDLQKYEHLCAVFNHSKNFSSHPLKGWKQEEEWGRVACP